MSHRIYCVLPDLPDRATGGGVLLYETLVYLLTKGTVHAVVPVARHLEDAFQSLARTPDLAGVKWHALHERPSAGLTGKLRRLLSVAPAEVWKFATPTNHTAVEEARAACYPTAELLIASRAAAAYRRLTPVSGARLYMMDVDARIVRFAGRSFARKCASCVEAVKIDRLCRRVLARAARVAAISEADVPELNRLGKRSDVRHVPPLMLARPADRSRAEPGHVLITTNFSYAPNVDSLEWFLRECWPHVERKARLTVTGIDAAGRLQRLCDTHERVAYAGCLPQQQLDSLFDRVSVAVNPTRSGSGFQIKLLEAIARGVPIVSTAFSNRIGPEIASSDDPVELARMINDRLMPNAASSFDYQTFHLRALDAWDAFLFS